MSPLLLLSLSPLEKELRKKKKKLRKLQGDENSDCIRILEQKIQCEKAERTMNKEIKRPSSNEIVLHKKESIQNVNELIMAHYMQDQMKVRMNIIHNIKEQLESEKQKEKKWISKD